MKRHISGIILFAAVFGAAHAQSEVFLCVDEHGNKEYKNTGTTKGCKKIDMSAVTVIGSAPKRTVVNQAKPAAAASPSDFPKVDSTTQKARDNDRRQILTDEMKLEEQKLDTLKKEYNSGEPERRGDERNYAKYEERTANLKEDVSRTEKNIEALKRELGNLK